MLGKYMAASYITRPIEIIALCSNVQDESKTSRP
jgi:hypothetical protein